MYDIQDGDKLARGQGRQPLYAALSDLLVKDIASGKYEVASTLPTEQELSSLYGVSRQTVRQALRVLKDQGLISSHPGIGTIVQAQASNPQKFRAVNSTSDLLQFVGDTEMHAVSLREVKLGPELAQALTCNEGQLMSEVAFLRRLPGVDLPMSYVLIYVNPMYAEAQITLKVSNTPIYLRMERLYGIKVHEIQQDVTVTHLDDSTAALLSAEVGEAALKITRYFYDINQVLVQVSISFYPASRYTQSALFRATDGSLSALRSSPPYSPAFLRWGRCTEKLDLIPDSAPNSIFSDVAIFNGLIFTPQIPIYPDGKREMGSITEQTRCALQALKSALEGPVVVLSALCTLLSI